MKMLRCRYWATALIYTGQGLGFLYSVYGGNNITLPRLMFSLSILLAWGMCQLTSPVLLTRTAH